MSMVDQLRAEFRNIQPFAEVMISRARFAALAAETGLVSQTIRIPVPPSDSTNGASYYFDVAPEPEGR